MNNAPVDVPSLDMPAPVAVATALSLRLLNSGTADGAMKSLLEFSLNDRQVVHVSDLNAMAKPWLPREKKKTGTANLEREQLLLKNVLL